MSVVVTTTRMRSFALGSIVAVAVFASSILPSSPASADDLGPETEFATRINEARTAAGLPALVVQPKLVNQARRWSRKMSEASGPNLGGACLLSHNPSLASEVKLNWTALGENVGCADGNVAAVHQAFMDSPEHRRNILDPKFDSVGIAISTSETTMFVTEVFMQSKPSSQTQAISTSRKILRFRKPKPRSR
jgi:uncharacterized protein YkwD